MESSGKGCRFLKAKCGCLGLKHRIYSRGLDSFATSDNVEANCTCLATAHSAVTKQGAPETQSMNSADAVGLSGCRF